MKMFAFALLTILFASVAAHAGDERLTKEQFLSGVSSGRIQLDRELVFNLPSNILDQTEDKIKLQFPAFKHEMMYAGYIKDNKFIYSLFFNWTVPECQLRIEELDKKTGKPNAQTLDPKGQKVDKQYCSKFLGINL